MTIAGGDVNQIRDGHRDRRELLLSQIMDYSITTQLYAQE